MALCCDFQQKLEDKQCDILHVWYHEKTNNEFILQARTVCDLACSSYANKAPLLVDMGTTV